MAIKTRIDARSEDNNTLYIMEGDIVIAEIKLLGDEKATLNVVTHQDMHLKKDNGWSSNKGK